MPGHPHLARVLILRLATLNRKPRAVLVPRRTAPALQHRLSRRNLLLVEELKAHAQAESCSPAQLALAWLLAQKPFVVPIPGTSHVRRLEENAAAAALSLSADTAEVLARVFAPGAAAGLRYPESHLARLGI